MESEEYEYAKVQIISYRNTSIHDINSACYWWRKNFNNCER